MFAEFHEKYVTRSLKYGKNEEKVTFILLSEWLAVRAASLFHAMPTRAVQSTSMCLIYFHLIHHSLNLSDLCSIYIFLVVLEMQSGIAVSLWHIFDKH